MHAYDLVRLANCFAHGAPAHLRSGVVPHSASVHSYWLSSRFRHEDWSARLAAHRTAISRPGSSLRARLWHEILPVIQEVLLSEPLVRCLAYHGRSLEERGLDAEFSPLVHSVMNAHVEARHRCLHLIVFGAGIPSEMAAHLNLLRQRLEVFSDALLSRMDAPHHVDVYRFGPRQGPVLGWRPEQAIRCAEGMRSSSAMLVLWAEAQIAPLLDGRIVGRRYNRQIAESVLQMLSPACFDSVGIPISARFAGIRFRGPDRAPGFEGSTDSSPLDLIQPRPSSQTSHAAASRRWS
ncbi:MAG: hypothetical protein D6753_10520 [Planctomycetota bacterium]|nr:MAG: hypothetical protein D6753_10520 [Planctomycetota bacterium]